MTQAPAPWQGPDAEWDDFVRRQPGWTHCHLAGWKDVMERALGHECPWLAVRENGALAGVLPLVRVRSAIFGHYLVSMPFLNYGGPLGSEAAVRALAAEAVRLARASGAGLLELRSRQSLPLELTVSHRKITVVLDLPEGPDALMKSFPAKLRSQVRRPQKEGVAVRFGPDQLDAFYQVFSRHMRDLGTPVLSRQFFQHARDRFGDSMWVGVAWLGDEPVACGAGFQWGSEFEMTWASSLQRYNRIAPNMLLYFAFMERAMAQGLARFNFGRCTPGSGTHRFKRQWGARDEPLHWYQQARGGAGHTPSPDDGAWSWGPRIWRHVPLPVANFLGPRVVRFIP